MLCFKGTRMIPLQKTCDFRVLAASKQLVAGFSRCTGM